jgi:hypothetical protein
MAQLTAPTRHNNNNNNNSTNANAHEAVDDDVRAQQSAHRARQRHYVRPLLQAVCRVAYLSTLATAVLPNEEDDTTTDTTDAWPATTVALVQGALVLVFHVCIQRYRYGRARTPPPGYAAAVALVALVQVASVTAYIQYDNDNDDNPDWSGVLLERPLWAVLGSSLWLVAHTQGGSRLDTPDAADPVVTPWWYAWWRVPPPAILLEGFYTSLLTSSLWAVWILASDDEAVFELWDDWMEDLRSEHGTVTLVTLLVLGGAAWMTHATQSVTALTVQPTLLAPSLASVPLWMTLLVAHAMSEDAQTQLGEAWVLPDSLLPVGAGAMLGAAWLVYHRHPEDDDDD